MSSYPGIFVCSLLTIALLVLAPMKDADALVCGGLVTFGSRVSPFEEPQSDTDCAGSLARFDLPGVRSGIDGNNLVEFDRSSWASDFHVTIPSDTGWLENDKVVPVIFFTNHGDGKENGKFDWNMTIEGFTVTFVAPFPEARLEKGDLYEWAVTSSVQATCKQDCYPISFGIAYTMDVPEPGTILLMGVGLSAFGFARRRFQTRRVH